MKIEIEKLVNKANEADVTVRGMAGAAPALCEQNGRTYIFAEPVSFGAENEEAGYDALCGQVVSLLRDKGARNVLFDIASLAPDGGLSYVANSLRDALYPLGEEGDGLNVVLGLPEGRFAELDPDSLDPERDVLKLYRFDLRSRSSRDGARIGDFDEYQKQFAGAPTFREYLCDLINERIDRKEFRKNSDVYKAAGVSKYTFSKIVNFSTEPPHKPSKETVAALAIGLRLDLAEAERFYNVAGYYLGKTELLDRIIRFHIEKKIYDIDEVNFCLDHYGLPVLGETPRSGDRGI